MSARFCLLVSILCLCGLDIQAYSMSSERSKQLQWPEVTQETKPWTRWWIFGNAVTKADLTAALEAYREAGIGGVEITPVYGVRGTENAFIEYLSPRWMEMLEYILDEAKRLDIGVDMANTSGWPFGGPWVDDSIACKSLRTKQYRVIGGDSLVERIEYIEQPLVYTQSGKKVKIEDVAYPITANDNQQENSYAQVWYKRSLPLVAVTASLMSKNHQILQTIELTDSVDDGVLRWIAPEGEWLVCALFQGYHGKMVERASPGGEGNVIDHFSKEAIDRYLRRFDEAFAGYNIDYLRYYFNDSYEVDDALGQADWTPAMFEEFSRICGYDLKMYLPALLGLADEETNSRVLHDYRWVISELMLERFTKPWQQWAASQGKGIRNQAHGSPANAMDLYAASDVPEMEGSTVSDIKSASSAAHVTGKRLTSAESCTWLNEHFQSRLADVKDANDLFLLGGVNHIFYHGTDYSPQDVPWPGWLYYAAVHFTPANSFWPDFVAVNEYVARAQSFLQAGRPSSDILLYYGIADVWSNRGKERFHYFHGFKPATIDACGRELLSQGYSWDAFSDRLLQEVNCVDGKLSAGGNVYKVILVPKVKYMPVATFERLLKLAESGAKILFCEDLPADVPGLARLQESRDKLQQLKSRLHFEVQGEVSRCVYGQGEIAVCHMLQAGLAEMGVTPEPMYKNGLQCIRRVKNEGGYYYFILNSTNTQFAGWMQVNADYETCALYNPMSGQDGYARIRDLDGKKELWIELKPGESMIVETIDEPVKGPLYPYYKSVGPKRYLDREWEITFTQGGPTLPKKRIESDLVSWTEYGDSYACFSGSAMYKTILPALPSEADAWRVEFEHIYESAAVYVNDKYVGTLLDNPYIIEIPRQFLTGSDTLCVRVSNLMANRIASMDKKGEEWKIFYNANMDSKGHVNRGKNGLFSAETWQPRPSGISGKVTLTPVAHIE